MNKINKQWHDEENEWWDRYSAIMAYQWKLNTKINNVIRKKMESTYQAYLYKDNGALLDIGCGTGWLSLSFAKKGMNTVGVDFSYEQIKEANSIKANMKASNSEFICTDFLDFDVEQHKNKYDSIFVNAFLHHLPLEELKQVFDIISTVSKKGAKIYLYEPIMFCSEKNTIIGSLALKIYNRAISFFTNKIPNIFCFWNDKYKKAIDLGYDGMSPNEGSIDFQKLNSILEENCIEVTSIRPEHYLSISYSILAHSMRKPYRQIYEVFVPLIYLTDKAIFKFMNWKAIARKRNFLLCSLELKQK